MPDKKLIAFPKPIVEFRDVFYLYPSEKEWQVESVNLQLGARDFLLLLGPNGGGKTTLIKLLLGFLKPVKGSVRVFGQNPSQILNKIGYVPQTFNGEMDFPITAKSVVFTGLKRNRWWSVLPTAEQKDQVMFWLQTIGLAEKANERFSYLSGGQRQRVLLARAMVSQPELLVLDEPMNNVDMRAKNDYCNLLDSVSKQCAVVMVSHDLGTLPKNVNLIGCVEKAMVLHGDLNSNHYQSPHHQGTQVCLVDLLLEQSAHSIHQFYQTLMQRKTS